MAISRNPLKFGSDAEFDAVRHFLRDAGYNTLNICARVGEKRLDLFEALRPRPEIGAEKDTLELLISLFSRGESVTASDASAVPDAFRRLGLIEQFGDERVVSPVAIGVVEDLYFVSDRWANADRSKFEIADDSVYPAITPNTLKFLDMAPVERCEALLDVGAGTGVGAILGATRYAERAWAVDITERSSSFAQFNCRLNALTNVMVVKGDLYEPVEGQTFDRIIAHPPYVPVLDHHLTFSDGGDDGELLTRRLIQGLPKALRAGGTFYCNAMGSDREQPFEERIRGWLGGAQGEFDVQVILRYAMEPMQFAMQTVMNRDGASADLHTWKKLFEGYKVGRLLFGPITIHRHVEKRKTYTARRVARPQLTRIELGWLHGIESFLAGDVDGLSMRPKLAKALELVVHHTVQDEKFAITDFEIRTQYPFTEQESIPGWEAVLLGRCDGEATVRELLVELKREGYLKPDVEPAEFAELVARFLARGYVTLAEMPLPERK